MVGGVVILVSRREGAVHVNVADCPHYPKHCIAERPDERLICPNPDTCCVYVKEIKSKGTHKGESITIKVGDSLWWQSGSCYWTRLENRGKEGMKGGRDYDIAIPKVGYSH